MNYKKIVDSIIEAISKSEIYWQLPAVISCLLITFIIYRVAQQILHFKIKKNREFSFSNTNKIITNYIAPLFSVTLAILILTIGMLIFHKFYDNTILFATLIKFSALFLLFRLLKIILGDSFIATLVAISLIPAIMLSIFGLLHPTITYLDSFSFSLGKVKISAYTIIKGSLILIIVFWVSGLISRKSKSYIQNNNKIVPNTKGVINKVIDIIIYLAVFIILLRVFGINTTTFAVLGGAIGVGIGLGLQKIASNFIGGIILLFEKSIEIGDLVEIAGGIEGIVTHFGGRYTLLQTLDGKEIMVPNEDFIVNRVINLTYNNNRARIEIKVQVSYDSDIDKVTEIMISSAKEHPKCLLYPPPEVYVVQFGENAIELIMHFWINNVADGRMRPKSDIMSEILKKFRKNNIVIPFPQREVHIKNQAP